MLDVLLHWDHAQLIREQPLHALNTEDQMVIARLQPHRHQQLLVSQRFAQMEYSPPTQHVKDFHINVSPMEQVASYQEAVRQSEQP